MSKYCTYVLYNKDFDKYYIGHTNDLRRRLSEHNSKRSKYTKSYPGWMLSFFKEFETRSETMNFEKKLKSFKNKNFLKIYIAG